MLIGWYSDKWWEQDDPEVKCNRTEMREAVKGYISMESLQLGDPSVVTVANIVSTLVILISDCICYCIPSRNPASMEIITATSKVLLNCLWTLCTLLNISSATVNDYNKKYHVTII